MPEPVVDVAQQCGVGSRQLEDSCRHLSVLALVVRTDVVDAARRAFAKHELDRGAVVLHVEPVADLPPVAVERKRLAVERVRDEQRDQLLRVLARAVRVRPACDAGVDTERPHRCEHLQIAARLRSAIRTGRA